MAVLSKLPGKQYFEISKTPDIGAPNGQGGEWLIDPFSITVVAGGGNFDINNSSPFVSNFLEVGSAQLGVDLILQALNAGDVEIRTGNPVPVFDFGNIIWNADLDFNNSTNNSTLSLDAIGSIFFNQSIFDSTPGGDVLNLVAVAGISIIFNADISTQGSLIANAPTVNLNSGYNLKSNNNPILVLADTFDSDNNNFVNTSINAGSSTITLAPFAPGTSLNIGTGPGILSLTDKDNPNIPDNFTTSSLLIFGISTTGPVTVNNVFIEQENVVINSGSSVTFTGTGVSSEFGSLTINASGDISVNSSIKLNNGDFSAASSSGDFTLASNTSISTPAKIIITANNITNNGTFSAGGTINLNGTITNLPLDITLQQGEDAANIFQDDFAKTGNDQALADGNGPPLPGC